MDHNFCGFAVACCHLYFKNSHEVWTNLIPALSEGRNISIMTSAFGLPLCNQKGEEGGTDTGRLPPAVAFVWGAAVVEGKEFFFDETFSGSGANGIQWERLIWSGSSLDRRRGSDAEGQNSIRNGAKKSSESEGPREKKGQNAPLCHPGKI